jgi:hypothetical protein
MLVEHASLVPPPFVPPVVSSRVLLESREDLRTGFAALSDSIGHSIGGASFQRTAVLSEETRL